MPGQFLFLVVSICLGILLGGWAIIVVLSGWKSNLAKFSLVLFMVSLISYPGAFLTMIFVVEYLDVFGRRGDQWVYAVMFWAGVIYPVWLGVSLLLYVSSHIQSKDELDSGTGTITSTVVWEIPSKQSSLVKILRRREWAFLAESLLAFFSYFVLFWAFNPFTGENEEMLIAVFIIWTFVIGCLAVFRDGLGGVSLGKLFFELRVVDARSGVRIGFAKSFQRNWLYLIPLFPLIELAFASCRADKQRIGDRIAGTVVVFGPPQFREGHRVEDSVDKKVVAEKAETPNPFE